MKPWRLALLLFVFSCAATQSNADDDLSVRYIGLNGKKAKLSINNRSTSLRAREASREGVMLLTASRGHAVVRIAKRNYLYKRGAKQGVLLPRIVKIQSDSIGMYRTTTDINGRPVKVVVDTGATFVSINRVQARKIGLRYRKNQPIKLQTASAVETAYLTTLESVRIGGIVRFNVPAVITKTKHPSVVLLGMSFLQGLNITQSDGMMVLQP